MTTIKTLEPPPMSMQLDFLAKAQLVQLEVCHTTIMDIQNAIIRASTASRYVENTPLVVSNEHRLVIEKEKRLVEALRAAQKCLTSFAFGGPTARSSKTTKTTTSTESRTKRKHVDELKQNGVTEKEKEDDNDDDDDLSHATKKRKTDPNNTFVVPWRQRAKNRNSVCYVTLALEPSSDLHAEANQFVNGLYFMEKVEFNEFADKSATLVLVDDECTPQQLAQNAILKNVLINGGRAIGYRLFKKIAEAVNKSKDRRLLSARKKVADKAYIIHMPVVGRRAVAKANAATTASTLHLDVLISKHCGEANADNDNGSEEEEEDSNSQVADNSIASTSQKQ